MTQVQEQVIQTYAFYRNGDQPLDTLKAEVEDLRAQGNSHAIMGAERYELIAIPNNMAPERFADEFNAYKAEPGTIYIAIIRLDNKRVTTKKYGPTGKIKTDNHIVKGARKWETLFVVYSPATGENPLPTELFSAPTKGEAMDFAREHANKTGEPVYIDLEKRLVGSGARVADLKPEVKAYDEVNIVPNNTYFFFGKGVEKA